MAEPKETELLLAELRQLHDNQSKMMEAQKRTAGEVAKTAGEVHDMNLKLYGDGKAFKGDITEIKEQCQNTNGFVRTNQQDIAKLKGEVRTHINNHPSGNVQEPTKGQKATGIGTWITGVAMGIYGIGKGLKWW